VGIGIGAVQRARIDCRATGGAETGSVPLYRPGDRQATTRTPMCSVVSRPVVSVEGIRGDAQTHILVLSRELPKAGPISGSDWEIKWLWLALYPHNTENY
jgi:hypothetical protein